MIKRYKRACTTHCPEENNLTSPLTQPCDQSAFQLHPGQHMAENRPASLPSKCPAAVCTSSKTWCPGESKRQKTKFCHPRSVASKLSFPWLSPGPTPMQLLFLGDNYRTCVPFFAHILATYLWVKSISFKFRSATTGGRTSSDLPLPLLGLFLPKTGKVSSTINESCTWTYLSYLQNSDCTPYRTDTEDSLHFAWQLAEV